MPTNTIPPLSPPFAKLYTIGYGNRTVDECLHLLQPLGIQFLIDVRSYPYAKYNKPFSQQPLKSKLTEHGIHYVFMGHQLGGIPEDEACYTEGKIDYQKVEKQDFYQTGIRRLEHALSQQLHVVLMCGELRPETCHRSKLIGETLRQKNIEVMHIDEKGQLQSQFDVILRLSKGQMNMFAQV